MPCTSCRRDIRWLSVSSRTSRIKTSGRRITGVTGVFSFSFNFRHAHLTHDFLEFVFNWEDNLLVIKKIIATSYEFLPSFSSSSQFLSVEPNTHSRSKRFLTTRDWLMIIVFSFSYPIKIKIMKLSKKSSTCKLNSIFWMLLNHDDEEKMISFDSSRSRTIG